MTDEKTEAPAPVSGGFMLFQMLLVSNFIMPATAVFNELHSAGGGIVRYGIGLPAALVFGTVIVVVNWNVGKFIWLRTKACSGRVQNLAGIATLGMLIASAILAAIVSSWFASALIRHVGP